jgi:hypothetical protein
MVQRHWRMLALAAPQRLKPGRWRFFHSPIRAIEQMIAKRGAR